MEIQKKIRKLLKDRKGFTLVELLVSFTLLLILLTSTFAILAPSTKVFMKSIGAGRAQTVSNIVMDRIVNELGSATDILSVNNGWIEYIDDGGNYVVMEMIVDKGSSGGGMTKVFQLTYIEDVNRKEWRYPEKTYMGNVVDKLKFSKVEDRDDLIQVELRLKNSQTGYEYDRTRIVKCNVSEE